MLSARQAQGCRHQRLRPGGWPPPAHRAGGDQMGAQTGARVPMPPSRAIRSARLGHPLQQHAQLGAGLIQQGWWRSSPSLAASNTQGRSGHSRPGWRGAAQRTTSA